MWQRWLKPTETDELINLDNQDIRHLSEEKFCNKMTIWTKSKKELKGLDKLDAVDDAPRAALPSVFDKADMGETAEAQKRWINFMAELRTRILA